MDIITYEYVGFLFEILIDENNRPINARALPDQHRAAYKEKHRMAALECYRQDHPIGS